MNRERAKELLPIIEAFANGEDIQFHDGDGWSDVSGREELVGECLDDDGLEYRIKPVAREFWVTISKTGNMEVHPRADSIWASRDIESIKVREIL